MNLDLFRSRHAAIAAAIVALLLVWHWLSPFPFGSRDDANVLYLLTTGWVAVAGYLILALYAVRRAAHRLRLSPEFQWKVALPTLEQAQSQLRELQNRMGRGEVVGRAAATAEAKRILQASGTQRTLRVTVCPDPRQLGRLTLEVGPRQPLGTLASWLHAHIFYGLGAALVVWFHGGARCGSTMGLWLNALSAFVIGSGLLGAVLWSLGPTWLTRAERELSIEKAFALREHLAGKLVRARALPQQEADDKRREADEATALAAQATRDAERTERSADELEASQRKAAEKAVEVSRLERWLRESTAAGGDGGATTATALQEQLDAAREAAQKAASDATRTARSPAELTAAKKAAQKKTDEAQKAAKKADELRAAIPTRTAELQPQVVVLEGQLAAVAREAARLDRYRMLLRGWRVLHVPASVALLGLVAVHVLSIYYY